ncbi:ACP S-malonyltransferase [Victivallis vadensis]|uniref:Malonyl CoA-acyl carrier protein transacylase n=2 Tax=Victivallis vadensis TaxID=172901 RepID=A0A2U1AQV5_9BACT|nr:ACP S-malonyltransferase [Victivallis vadensis]NMD88507.1 ACP S-malonyltransferase [Victivallis vadensis]PVY38809.1 [acyl-carrier-protein] S-malonyltransferase [Victivallis vadensis]HJH05647.1 ACP S-malonyltransferase [Victivallis vadensis]
MKAFFVFSGQGAQTVGMGKDLAEAFPEAKALFDEADAVLGYEQSSIIFNGPAEKLTESRYCQPAIYTMSCAALAAFKTRYPDVTPVGCAGLSLGEYGALYAGGAFTFAEGLRLLAQRAELMDKACRATSGGMASVLGGDAEIIKEVCAACEIDVANFNSPGQIVISGEKVKLAKAVEELKARGMRKIIVLNVAGAFHSRLMKPAGEALEKVLEESPVAMPRIPVYHNFTAAPAADVAQLRANLAAQVAGSVRWEECVRNMVAAGGDTMIEFGPGNVLTGLLRRTLPEVRGLNVNSAETLRNIEL